MPFTWTKSRPAAAVPSTNHSRGGAAGVTEDEQAATNESTARLATTGRTQRILVPVSCKEKRGRIRFKNPPGRSWARGWWRDDDPWNPEGDSSGKHCPLAHLPYQSNCAPILKKRACRICVGCSQVTAPLGATAKLLL